MAGYLSNDDSLRHNHVINNHALAVAVKDEMANLPTADKLPNGESASNKVFARNGITIVIMSRQV